MFSLIPAKPFMQPRLGDQRRWCETEITSVPNRPPPENLLQIQSCESSAVVADLAGPFVTSMNIHDVCVVFDVLKRFGDEPQPEFMDKLADQVLKQKAALQSRHITQLFHACAKLGYKNTALFEALGNQSLLPFQLEAFTHTSASIVLYSIGSLVRDTVRRRRQEMDEIEHPVSEAEIGQPMPNTLHAGTFDRASMLWPKQSEFVDLLLRRFVTVTEHDTVTGWQVSNAFYGVAAVRSVNRELFKKLVDMAIRGPIFRELTDQGITQIIHCFGYLRHRDDEALELILSNVLHPSRLPVFAEAGLNRIIQGLSLLNYSNRQNLLVILSEALRPWRLRKYTNWELSGLWLSFYQLGIRDSSFLDLLTKETMHPERLKNLSPRALFSILMSMSKLKYRHNEFLHTFVDEISTKRRMNSIQDKDYPGYVWILGQLQYNNPEDMKKMMDTLLCTNRLEQMLGRTLASIFYGLVQCGVKDHSSIQTLLREIARPERLPSYLAHSLASLVHSLGQLKMEMCPLSQAIVNEALREKRVFQYSEYGLVAVLHGLTSLGVTDHQMLKPVLDEIRKPHRIAAYEPGALSCLVFGLSSLQNRDTDLLTRLAEEIVKDEKLCALSGSGVTSLIVNFAELKFVNLDIIERLLTVLVNSNELRTMSSPSLASFVYALGQLNYHNSPGILLPIIDELTARRASFRNHELGAVINGLGHMGIQFDEYYTLQHIIGESLKLERISSYTIKELGRICSALSLMKYSGPNLEPLVQRLFRPDIFQSLDFRDLAGSAYALGHAGIKNEAMVAQMKTEIFRRGRRIETKQRYLGLLIQGIGPMCSKKDYSFGQMLLELVHYHYGQNIDELTNMNLTAILYGLGQIGVGSKSMLYPFVLDSIKTRRLQQYSTHALATLVFGLGQFRFCDEKALIPVIREVCRESRIKYFTNRQLIGTIFSFCNMKMTREDLMTPLLEAASRPTQLQRCAGSDLSMLFYSLVKIKPKEQSYLQNALLEVVHPERRKSLGDMALNAILYSMTSLRVPSRNPAVLRPLVDQLCLPGRLEKMDGTILGNIMYSLGKLDYAPEDFMDIVATEASKLHRLRQFNETALCNIINTLGKCKYDNKAFLNTLMEEAMRSNRLPRYHEGHIQNIIYTLGALRFCYPRFIAFMDRVLSDVHEVNKFQPKTLLMIMYSYQLLGVGSQMTVATVSKSILSNPKRRDLLSDVQLECLMETLGNIQRNDRSQRESFDRTDVM